MWRTLRVSVAALPVLVAAIIAMTPAAAFAASLQAETRAELLLADWGNWLEKHRVGKAGIAASLDGEAVRALGTTRSPGQAAPIGSISKMITGICTTLLVREGKLSFDAPVSTYVTAFDSDASIGSLLKQTAGYRVDPTQGGVDHYPGFDREYLVEMGLRMIEANRDKRKPGEWHYNNGNYSMVGAAISAVTGKRYEEACGELVLEPAGIKNPSLIAGWKILSSWGGWQLSAMDMISFMNHYFTNDTVAGVPPENLPHHDFGNGLNYGLGYMFREGRHGGFNFFHDGRWHVDYKGRKYRWGAYLVRFDNGWAVATNHDTSALNGEHGELDKLIATATHKKLD